MSKLNKEDWTRIEKALSGTYGMVKLKVDGREVTFQRALVSKNRLGIGTYVDGVMKGAWVSSENHHPEQRYLRPVSRFAHKPKERAMLQKTPKRLREELGPFFDPDRKIHFFDLTWPSATAIRRHYQQTFESIEILEVIG